MPKTLNEHADDLKRYIIEFQSDAHNVIRWLNKSGTLAALIETWYGVIKNGGREKDR